MAKFKMECKILTIGLIAGMIIGGLVVCNNKGARTLFKEGEQKVKEVAKTVEDGIEEMKSKKQKV